MGIPAAYVSRVSNCAVLHQVQERPLSTRLLQQQQMNYLGDLARRPGDDPVRACVFHPGTIQLRGFPGVRRVGRPRVNWASAVRNHCLQLAGLEERVLHYFREFHLALEVHVHC